MQNLDSVRKELIDFLKTHANCFSYLLQHSSKYEHFKNAILNWCPDILDLPFSTRVYWFLNKITEYPKCANPNCGKELRHDLKCKPLEGYVSTTCSSRCGQLSPQHKEKLKAMSLQKYGCEFPQQSKQFKDKLKETLASKDKQFWKNADDKRKQTCLAKYGSDSISKVKEIKNKAIAKLKSKSEEEKKLVVAKIKATKLQKYGNENYRSLDKFKETLSKFTDDKRKNIVEKRKNTVEVKYGCSNISQSQQIKNKIQERRTNTVRSKFYATSIANDKFVSPMFSIDYYIQHASEQLTWKCKKCGKEFNMKIGEHQPYIARCLDCFPLNAPTSKSESEIVSFIQSICNYKITRNDRTVIAPYELDIYIPEKHLAIEFDGLYWHSENLGTSKSYHLNKTKICESKNIHLVHIFENEWKCKQNIVKSRLKDLLGIYDKTIFARKCNIVEVNNADAQKFLQENHLQGNATAKKNYGLLYKNELVSLMTFSRKRYKSKIDSNNSWEMVRFCCKLGYHIPGAASRLLKKFENEHNNIVLTSYADRRWSQGKLYEALGFKLDHASAPNYWYWKYDSGNMQLKSRIECQKHKLKNILNKFDSKLSERDNMFNNGFFRIFDCGNLVYVKNNKSEK